MTTQPPPPPAKARAFSIRRLRTLILVVLVAGASAYTGVMLMLVQRLSERFGPQVRADLEWRALHGAGELANTADIGLAVSDTAMVTESFGAYAKEEDVEAIVALDADGRIVARHGTVADVPPLFAGKAGTLTTGNGYLASWAPAVIEGREVGKVAIVVSTRRLTDARSLLSNVSRATVIAGIAGLALGMLVILFFTRAVSLRDAQLNDYAHNLEQRVEARTAELDERTRGMRLVLDNVAQGFITIDLVGTMAAERSAIVDRWFGTPPPGTKFGALIDAFDPDFTTWFELRLDGVRDGFLPVELCLEQMPSRFTAGGRKFGITYSPIFEGDNVARLLLIISDVTAQVARDRELREQREQLAIFQRILTDRNGVVEFLAEAHALVDGLAASADPVVEKRAVHTLKGNCAIYGLERFAELCDGIESAAADACGPLSEAQRQALRDGWHEVVHEVSRLLGNARREVVEVDRDELARVVEKARQGASGRELAVQLELWTHDPVARRLERLGEQAKALSQRLGKGELTIEIDDPGKLHIDGERWAPFWSAMVHAVRNAIDHGIEAREVRAAAGKPAEGTLSLAAARRPGEIVVAISDDGAGIDWGAVRARAARLGLPSATRDDLVAALFADGVSTREQATDISGRGVGLAALRETTIALGGAIEVTSTPGHGTTLCFRFPYAEAPSARPRTQSQQTKPTERSA